MLQAIQAFPGFCARYQNTLGRSCLTVYGKLLRGRTNMAANTKPYLNIQSDWTEILRQEKWNELVGRLQSTYMFIIFQEFWWKSVDIMLKEGWESPIGVTRRMNTLIHTMITFITDSFFCYFFHISYKIQEVHQFMER
jgi:hypothetical protein